MALKRSDIQGQTEQATRRLHAVKLVRPLRRLSRNLRSAGTSRDRAGNHQFFYDHDLSLLLL